VSNSRFLFPIYNSREAAAVNLLNLVVQAFHADVAPFYDVWEAGFARAVTARIARGSAFRSLAGLNPAFIDRWTTPTTRARITMLGTSRRWAAPALSRRRCASRRLQAAP